MPDTISNYRQVRLIISPGRYMPNHSSFHLHAVVVRNGVPHSTSLASGLVPLLPHDCSEAQIRAAVLHAAEWLALHR